MSESDRTCSPKRGALATRWLSDLDGRGRLHCAWGSGIDGSAFGLLLLFLFLGLRCSLRNCCALSDLSSDTLVVLIITVAAANLNLGAATWCVVDNDGSCALTVLAEFHFEI